MSNDSAIHEQAGDMLSFWQTLMDGAPSRLELPRDFPRPSVPSNRMGHVPIRIPDKVVCALQTLCHNLHGTVFHGLLASFAALLARCSGETAVVVGVSLDPDGTQRKWDTNGRVNLLPVRLNVSHPLSFQALVQQTSDTLHRVSAHAEWPLQRIADELGVKHPLFQVALDFTHLPHDNVGPLAHQEAVDLALSVDLGLHLEESQGQLYGYLAFAMDLFLPATVQRFSEHLVNLLEQAFELPDCPIGLLQLQSNDDLRQQLVESNRTNRSLHFAKRLVHYAVAEQARHTPEAMAVITCYGTMSYAELDRRARALAHYLREHGIGVEIPVGVCSPRSADVLVALLGILHAGGCYVPLDPSYPLERLAFMIEDAKISTVLVPPGTRVHLPSHVQTIELDPELFEGNNCMCVFDSISPDNLAYIIYTSGSTGTPKGVMVSHAAMLNTLAWMQETFHLSSDDVVAHKTSISFTDSIWELLWPILVGSQLVVIEENVSQFPRLLIKQLRQHKVTVTQFVPAQMRLFLDEINREANSDPLPCLRLVFNGGEMLPPALARDWYDAFPQTLIANAYGMTESAIYGTNWIVEPSKGEPLVLIGRPISNERAYILDRADQPCPALYLGEIHLGGSSLARGYVNQPGLTAAHFIPDPFGPPGSRMYRTGDLGRQLVGGEIACLGRLDRQVKVRGSRVELGEIETVLAKHPDVRQVVVITKRQGDDNHMVAFYLYHTTDPGPRELARFLAGKLPSFMIPSYLVAMETFPLSFNGKVDCRRLLEQTG